MSTFLKTSVLTRITFEVKKSMAARPEIPELPLSMRRVEVLQGVMVTKIFNAILQWPGFTARNLVDLLIDSLPRVQDCLADLVGAGLLIVIPVWELRDGTLVSLKRPEINEENPIIREFHMYYGSETAAIYVGHRDGSSLKRIRTRIEEDIRGDHNDGRPKFRHTLKLNDCVVALSLGGFRPFAGYRGSLFIPGGSQLVPDAWMLVRVEIPLSTTAADGRLGCWTVLKSQRLATANVSDPNETKLNLRLKVPSLC